MNTITTPRKTEIVVLEPLPTDVLIDRFIADQDVMPSSKALYKRTLKQYFTWVKKKGYLLSEIARPQIIEFKEELLAEKSSLTAGSYVTTVRLFYEWVEANRLGPNVARGVRSPKRVRRFKKEALTPHQVKQLLEYYQTKTLRDFAIVNLLVRTGLRTIEATRCDIGDVVYKGGKRVLLIHGKGCSEKNAWVLLTDKTYLPICNYLASRKNVKETDPLFVSVARNSKGKRLTTMTISSIAKEGLKAIGLNHRAFTAHSLRHTCAVSILRAGMQLEDVQFTLRHASIATTQIYTETLNEQRRLQNSGEAILDTLF